MGKTMNDDKKISDADLEGVAGGKGMTDYDKKKAKWIAEQEETKPDTKPDFDTGK